MDNQQKLFDLLAEFATDTVLGWVSLAYKSFTQEVMKTTFLNILLSRFAQVYFNNCAHWVYNRNDAYINQKFDIMLALEMPDSKKPYDPIDLLHIIVPMSMQILTNMNIKDIVGPNYELTMEAVRAHLRSLVRQFNHIATGFHGCECPHEHTPPGPDEKVFSIALQKAIMDRNGQIEIKDNWFEDI